MTKQALSTNRTTRLTTTVTMITLALTKFAYSDDSDEELAMSVQTKINICDKKYN